MTTASATPTSSPPPGPDDAQADTRPWLLRRGKHCLRAVSVLGWMVGLSVLARYLYDEDLVASLRDDGALVPEAASALEQTHEGFGVLLAACGLLGAALLLLGRPRSRKSLGAFLSLSITAYAVLALELLAAPLAPPLTAIFEPHDSRGWALVPGAQDEWMGVPVEINEQGMRGPVREIPKPHGVRRVLFLGDSVTFGFQLERDADTLPAQAEVQLELLGARGVQTINAGVGGYSPWQEVRMFVEEGLRYEPDVVVVNFVLNDVSEKLSLARFGGDGQGFQLEHSRAFHGLAWRSNIVRYLRRKRAQADGADTRFERNDDVDELWVGDLLLRPNASEVDGAWQRTLPELARLIAHCRQRGIPILLTVFPFTIQLERPELDAPQRRLEQFALEQGVEMLDMTPHFLEALQAEGGDVDALFIDGLHLTAKGSSFAAGVIAQRLVEGRYLPD